MGGTVVSFAPVVCVGPVKYRGEASCGPTSQRKGGGRGRRARTSTSFCRRRRHPASASTSTTNPTKNTFTRSRAAMAKEYQRDLRRRNPGADRRSFLPEFLRAGLRRAQIKRRAEIYVDATNAALKGIPPEKIRFHTCYGINEGPRIHEAALIRDHRVRAAVNAGSYSFEAANPRHEHEYHLFEREAADGKVLCPGVITHASNIVEHPELIAERIMRFAKLVGRENVMAARRLRLLLAGALSHRGAPHRGVGEVQGDARAPTSRRGNYGRRPQDRGRKQAGQRRRRAGR